MSKGRPKAALLISEAEREELLSISRSRSLPAAMVLRAKIVLGCESAPDSEVARVLGTHPATVGKWRNRFIAQRLSGLHDEWRPGKPRTIDEKSLAELIHKTLHSKPAAGTHWSVREMAQETKISKSSVHRLFQMFGLQPHRQETFRQYAEAPSAACVS